MSNNNKRKTQNIPNGHSNRGAQTPTYTPPPMPKVKPAKSSQPSKPKK